MDIQAPFVAFEGIDKSGKGTQSRRAAGRLKQAWGEVVFFSEPNDTDSMVGRYIRRVLKHEIPAPPLESFQRLYVMDRAQDTVCTVLPALERGIPVVAERFALSTIAYGSLSGDFWTYVRMHEQVLGPWLRWPDLTVFIDISVETAMERLARESGRPEYFERADKLARIREAYLQLMGTSKLFAPDMRTVVVDGEGTPDEVEARVTDVLAPYLS